MAIVTDKLEGCVRLKQGEEGRVTDFSKCNDSDDEDEYEDEDKVDEGLLRTGGRLG